ncbi:tipD [Acrasis kona]|uniref:TipD n=1 Tax=Acrasis kona TaxID=1008807 RepID=A0AAW2Z7P7_9EUKA
MKEELLLRDHIISELKNKLRSGSSDATSDVEVAEEAVKEGGKSKEARYSITGRMLLQVHKRSSTLQASFINVYHATNPKSKQYHIDLETTVNDIKFSADSQLLAIACNNKTVKLYAAKSGGLEHIFFGASEHLTSVDLTPTLVVSASTSVHVWSIHDKKLLHTLNGHTKHVYGLGTTDVRAVSGSCDRTIKIWELNQGECLKTIDSTSIVNDLTISNLSNMFFSVHHDSHIRTFDLRSFNKLEEHKVHNGQVLSVAISADDRHVVTCGQDSICKVWDARVGFGSPVYTLKADGFKTNVSKTKAVLSPCGTFVASGSNCGHVFVWHLVDGTPLVSEMKEHNIASTCCAWSRDGKQVASSSIDRRLCLYAE